jgi:putative Holliday junction resolvase
MRKLGIDYGTKKVGLALTDESGGMAFPHSVVPNDQNLLTVIERLVQSEGVTEIVIGHSLNTDGSPNPVQSNIEELITDLTLAVGLPIHLEPEHYSSQQASRVTGKNTQIDASAAAIILESYLTKHPS